MAAALLSLVSGWAHFPLFAAVGGVTAQAPYVGNAVRGRLLFQQNCALCHATGGEAGSGARPGPLLAGVVRRRAGALAGFGYSRALAASNLTWDFPTLNRFLAGPGALVPGTAMTIIVLDAEDRIDLIGYLSRLPTLPGAVAGGGPPARHRRTPGDWQNDAPGVRHRIRLANLPPPYATVSAGNDPQIVDRPAGALPRVPAGFQVGLYASGLLGPRLLRTAPNGDVFVAETGVGRIRILRAAEGAGTPYRNAVFADHLPGPFGIAFYPPGDAPHWVYVANLNSVVRFPYRNGDLRARGPARVVVPRLTWGVGGHTTRDVVFSPDSGRMFLSVGSASNIADWMAPKSKAEAAAWEAEHRLGSTWGNEFGRADILETDPEGRRPLRVFATGIRNGVTIAVQPGTDQLWVATNERDFLGDDLVPDYVTRVREGGFYGWPWYYMGNHEDPRHAGERPDLADKAIMPDVPLQAHSAPLQLAFYPASATGAAVFPAEYRGDIFVALHGSFNRTGRTGSKVVRLLLRHGRPTGEYEDFLTGFVIDDAHVWGRPVGVTIARDGALLVSDDGNGDLWRVAPRADPLPAATQSSAGPGAGGGRL
ncbi:MAG TPA: PQQ-dependent sugar dehydrogenase [Opitutaceae bacterium]|nr:PQQ-dependent sugar dehydrogenase [Opitutaceae bacterium]